MEVRVTSDSNWEAGLEDATRSLDLNVWFEQREYGPGLRSLAVILNCRRPELQHMQRIRFAAAERVLYIDVMFDLGQMSRQDSAGRRSIVGQRVLSEVARVLQQRRLKEFNSGAFVNDLRVVLEEQLGVSIGGEAS